MTTPEVQLAAKFAFTTYVGELLTSGQPLISHQESDLLNVAMGEAGLGDWEVVWGPMLFRFPATLTGLYDNMMFVARKDDEYMIAVRGTNGHAKLDWLFEDFWVIHQVAWSRIIETPTPAGIDPKISSAAALGIGKLLGTPIVGEGLPGRGTHLVDYMKAALAGRSDVKVTVAGHSLGGALAPTLALYLNDTRGRAGGWDENAATHVACYAFAGPTAGNGDFARYTDQRLGTNAQRVVNPLDAVALAWFHEGMEQLKSLYDNIDHPVHLGFAKKLGIDAVIELMKVGNYDYEQYHQSGPGLVMLDQITNHQTDSFGAQAGWQHVQGYENLLGIGGLRDQQDAIFAEWCKRQPPDTCPKGI